MEMRHLQLILPHAPAESLQWLNASMAKFDLLDLRRQVPFLAELGHESAELTRLTEGLNYSADALLKLFPTHFSADDATSYARNPQRIANRMYANRGGNGDEASGDGWRFRGAGAFQLTFRNNHLACANYFGMSLAEVSDWLRTMEGACMSAGWFWTVNNLNKWADAGDFDGVSDVINRGHKTAADGDSIGWADRVAIYERARRVLA